MTLPDMPGGTSLDFDLLADLFGVSAGGEIPARAGLTQSNVEADLKQREIQESPGWLGAHEAGFFGLIPGVALIPNILMNLATNILGLPLGMWPGTGPLGFLGEIPNILADIGNFFTNIFDFFGGIDFNDLIFDVAAAWSNLISTVLNPLGLLEDLGIRDIVEEMIDGFTAILEGIPFVGPFLADLWETLTSFFDSTEDTAAVASDASLGLTATRELIVTNITGTPSTAPTDSEVDDALAAQTNEVTNAFSWITDFFNAVTGQTQAEVPVSESAAQAAALAESAVANAIEIARLKAAQDGQANSGLVSADDFERVATADINGPDGVGFWDETTQNPKATHGYYAIDDGHTAHFVHGSSGPTVTQYQEFRRTKSEDAQTMTSYQKITFVVGPYVGMGTFFSAPAVLRLRGRLNTASTEEVFCNITADGTARFGYRNGSTSDNLIGSLVNVGGKYAAGTTWTLECGTLTGIRQFRLWRNNSVVLIWNDTGALTAEGASNRGWGWGGAQAAAADGYFRSPPDCAIITIADNFPVNVVGSGLEVTRFSGTGVAGTASSEVVMPNNFWDTVIATTPAISWNATTGTATVNSDGWYDVSLMLNQTVGIEASTSQYAAIFVDGAVAKWGQRMAMSFSGGVTGDQQMGVSAGMYLTAGQQIQAGYYKNGFAPSFKGDAAGRMSWMSIIKCSPAL